MRRIFPSLILITGLLLLTNGSVAQGPLRSVDAVRLLRQCIAVMGGNAPSSSEATGTIELVEGSLRESGTIRILTRGLDEAREEIKTSRGLRGRIYAKGMAARIQDDTKAPLSLEEAATSQSPNFLLPFLVSAFTESDYALEYIGAEIWKGATVHHIRLWKTYPSNPDKEHLADFGVKDVWIDAASRLPVRVAYDERSGSGAVATFHIEAHYSDFRNVNGVLYPFLIKRVFNGTPWATITIERVVINADVSDGEFSIQ